MHASFFSNRKPGNLSLLPTLLLSAALILGSIGAPLSVHAAADMTQNAQQSAAAAQAGQTAPTKEAGKADGGSTTAAAAVHGTAWTDSTILGTLRYDTPVRLQDDYYSSANQEWLTNTAIPSGQSEVSPSAALSSAVAAKKRSLLHDRTLESHDAKLTQTLYDVLMDWDTRNALGIEPIRPYVQAIASITSIKELSDYLCNDAANLMGNGFSEVGISQYINNPTQYAVEIAPTSLLLTDPADYSNISADGKTELALAQSKAYYMLGRLGYNEEEQKNIFQGCLAFETALAGSMYPSRVTSQDDYAITTANRPCTLQDLRKAVRRYPLLRILKSRGLDTSLVYNLSQPEWLAKLDQLYTKKHLDEMKDYLIVHTVIPGMELTDQDAMNAMIELSGTGSGSLRTITADDIACSYVSSLLTEPLDNLYVQACCTPQEKADVTALVEQIISGWRMVLEDQTWLSDTTRQEALNKLAHLRVRVAYPDQLPDYSGLTLKDKDHGGDVIHNFQIIRTFARQQAAALVNQPLDDSHWAMPASTVNCFYNPQDNSINILAGMLQAPYYSEHMSTEELYAGIGFIIGHEISHAFDAEGAAFDESGNVRSWWAAEDRTAYEEKRGKLVSYYNGIVPHERFGACDGEQIADEAIADMGGMKCMLTLAGQIPAFDYDKFFRYFASCWKGLRRAYTELTYLRQDEHPLYYLRVNVTLQQFQPFLDTYQIREGDGMWLAPEDRISIW